MNFAHTLADWLQARIVADGTHTAIAQSVSAGDDGDPEKINIVWQVNESERLTAELREYQCIASIRRPVDSGLTQAQHTAVAAFLRAQITADGLSALVTLATANGVGTVNDWFYGGNEEEHTTKDYRIEQALRVWVVE